MEGRISGRQTTHASRSQRQMSGFAKICEVPSDFVSRVRIRLEVRLDCDLEPTNLLFRITELPGTYRGSESCHNRPETCTDGRTFHRRFVIKDQRFELGHAGDYAIGDAGGRLRHRARGAHR